MMRFLLTPMLRNYIFALSAFLVVASAYEVGVTNKYRYETTVITDEHCQADTKHPVGHSLKTQVHLTAVWQYSDTTSQRKLIKIELLQPELLVPLKSEFQVRKSNLDKLSSSPSFILVEDGKILKVWDDSSENTVLRNLKRAIAGLILSRSEDKEAKEIYVAGHCDVLYETKENVVRKTLGNCHHSLRDKSAEQAFGIRSASIQQATNIECELKDGKRNLVSKCIANDFVKTFSNLWKRPSICTRAKSELVLEGEQEAKETFKNKEFDNVIQEIKNSYKGTLEEGTLEAIIAKKQKKAGDKLAESILKYQDSLKAKNLAKIKSASAFYKLLPIFRSASKDEIFHVLKNEKLKPIFPQVLDLAAAASTQESLKAVIEYFGQPKDYDENLERFLVALSLLPRPDELLLKELMGYLKKGNHHEKIEATVISVLGSLLRVYSEKYENSKEKILDDVRLFLEGRLQKCNKDECVLSHLRGLRNAAQYKSYPVLMEYATKDGKAAMEALLALRNIHVSQLSPEIQHALGKIYLQTDKKQDRSVRALAAEILVARHSDQNVLKSILSSLSDQRDPEFSTYVASKIMHMMSVDKQLRSKILKILTEKEIAHYYSLLQKGTSSLVSRQLTSMEGTNVTYGIEMEMLEGGLMKRSSFDVNFEAINGVSNLLSVGMFAEGLSSVAGVSSGDDDSNPSAGMELTLLGSSLRPYVFFSSTSELMGHAWSGTASDPTPAFQGIFSLSDDENIAVLNNGMIVRLHLRSILSTDLSASIQISLWNRNSVSQVKNAAAMVIKNVATIDADFVTTQGGFSVSGESAIDFKTDFEFYESPFKMCLQMEHPDLHLRHDHTKIVQIAGTKLSVKRSKKRKRMIHGRSYALHQRNSEQCKLIASS